MKVNLNNNNLSIDLEYTLKRMEKACVNDQKYLLKSIGNIIKKNVLKNMKFRSGINASSYIHMRDDVKISVKKNRHDMLFVSVSGGKKTGYKWIFLNDGAIDGRGNVLVEATHFMEKSISDANTEIEKEIDSMIERIINQDGG